MTNAWEPRKFSDIAIRESKQAVSASNNPSVEYEDIVAEEGKLNKDISNKKAVKKGIQFDNTNILYGKLRPYLHNWLNASFSGVAVGDWWVLKPIEIRKSFLYFLIQTRKYDNVANLSTGSKMPRSDWHLVSNTKFDIPIAKEEQEKIGRFLGSIDSLVTLHQRELDNLKALKKTLLSKMFPKNDEKYPEIRFSGFTDAWELRKLGEIGITKSGVGFPDKEQGGRNGIPFFKISDMNIPGNEYEMLNSNNYVTDEQIQRKNWKVITDVPALIFAKVGAAIMLNRKRIVRRPFLMDNNTMVYIFSNSWDTNFGKYLFETVYLPKYVQVGALPSYNSTDIETINIKLPKNDEQQKIGNIFKHLDELITLHQRKTKLRFFYDIGQ